MKGHTIYNKVITTIDKPLKHKDTRCMDVQVSWIQAQDTRHLDVHGHNSKHPGLFFDSLKEVPYHY